MVANAEPWLGDIARRVATEEPKAEDTDDEDESWEDAKKSNEDGALDHIVASALKGAVPSRRSAVRDLLLNNGVTSDVLIHASGSAAGAQLVLHALDELAERHTPNGLCFPASFLRRRRVDGVEVLRRRRGRRVPLDIDAGASASGSRWRRRSRTS